MKFKTRRIILLISLILLIIILGFLIIFLVNRKTNDEFKSEPVTLSFESRVDKLETFDTGNFYKFGWLQVQGTYIDMPILDYRSSEAIEELNYSYGWLSSNYVQGENRMVIMGHNIINVSSTPMLPDENMENFEEIMAFSYEEFAKDNLYIQLTIDGKDEIYAIYAVGFYDYGYIGDQSMSDDEVIKEYIKDTKKNSIYDYGITVNENDDLLVLKTCTRFFGANEKQIFMINARKLRENEQVMTYRVRANKNYKEIFQNFENM